MGDFGKIRKTISTTGKTAKKKWASVRYVREEAKTGLNGYTLSAF